MKGYKKYLENALNENNYKTDITTIKVGDIVQNENDMFGKVTYIDDEVIIIEYYEEDKTERYFPDEFNEMIKLNKIKVSGE